MREKKTTPRIKMSERMEGESGCVGVEPSRSVSIRSSSETVPRYKRIKLMATDHQVIEVDMDKESTPPIGLKLERTTSLAYLIETSLSLQRQLLRPEDKPKLKLEVVTRRVVNGALSMSTFEKMKASNFPATYLRIGSWECMSRYDGDLVAKCYFAKRKLVWEVLQGALKSKIEFEWSDITSLRATYEENKCDILEIELAKIPRFFHEINPQPRKHTMWQSSPDFTGGQAIRCRRHWIQFNEGTLEKHLEKLLQFDSRLLMLSKAGFPSSPSPYFETDGAVQHFDQQREGCHLHGLHEKGPTIPFRFNNISNVICHPHVNQTFINMSETGIPFRQDDLSQFLPVNNPHMTLPSSGMDCSLNEEIGVGEYNDSYRSRSLQNANQFHGSTVADYHSGNINMSSDVRANQLNNFSPAFLYDFLFSGNGDGNSFDIQLWNIARNLLFDHGAESCGDQDGQIFPNLNSFPPTYYAANGC